MNWKRIATTGAVLAALLAISGIADPLPGDADYVPEETYEDPLRPSSGHPGPCSAETLEDCVTRCRAEHCRECLDWVQSIYDALDTRPTFHEDVKLRGVWLPTLDAVRAAAHRIPQLKTLGINAVSFGPDIITRDVPEPVTVGDRAIRFYVRLFQTAGLFVYLVPNAMHWGNNDVSLDALGGIVLRWAEEAEALGVALYATPNEIDGMREDLTATSAWLRAILPSIRARYAGLVGVQPTQAGFKSGRLDVSGYDAVSPLFSLMVPDAVRNAREIAVFLAEANRVRRRFPSVHYVMLSDVATFSGGNWAETFLMESQARAVTEGRTEYADGSDQAAAFEAFLAQAHPEIDGSFFNLWVGFSFLGRPAERVAAAHWANGGAVAPHPFDTLWGTPGFLELLEDAMMTAEERVSVFDLATYVAGWAGLCHEPSAEQPGPFDCTSVTACMECFRENPEIYWHLAGEDCTDDD